ncbi:hypothetical protein K3G63_21235 [Hymenobacter sp. HSC-4F20]|uniref:hypothetical protein n=1 Tax=Hymenobacter sp. HSC-4F20 TaxID=2864135 RepID=UPI001C72A981|nr:hypothetical protein [Hymenobacter sp. HSC-4F20]MBX0292981.1 hypothetical protein [Hymenobacter sp. HSC-4F20]
MPFLEKDCELVATDLEAALRKRAPAVLVAFQQRGWRLPSSLGRLYVSTQAEKGLGWVPQYSFEEVLAQLDRGSLAVLPTP